MIIVKKELKNYSKILFTITDNLILFPDAVNMVPFLWQQIRHTYKKISELYTRSYKPNDLN